MSSTFTMPWGRCFMTLFLASSTRAAAVPRTIAQANLIVQPSSEYSRFTLTETTVEVESIVPMDTEWFGFHVFPAVVDPLVLNDVLAGNPLIGDPRHTMSFMFRIEEDLKISASAQWGSYLGLPVLDDPDFVFECTSEHDAQTNGTVCQYDATTQAGDFMVKLPPFLLGLRNGTDPLEIVSLERMNNDTQFTVHWRKQRVPPFDAIQPLRIRYARKPQSYVPIYDTGVWGFEYHGAMSRETQVIDFFQDITASKPIVVDGLVQSVFNHTTKEIYVGGRYGWGLLLENINATGYSPIVVPVGTTAIFEYGGLVNVAELPSFEALTTCSDDAAIVVGQPLASPTRIMLDQPGVRYFASTATPMQCASGFRVMIQVVSDTMPQKCRRQRHSL